jgi:hypothetical protein
MKRESKSPASAATRGERAAPELLAPAGNWDCARAAIENGADAIYFGLQAGFNARARAANGGWQKAASTRCSCRTLASRASCARFARRLRFTPARR